MAVTDISICSEALLRLGDRTISSFEGGDDRVILCANIYPTRKDAILSQYDWRFTVKKEQLDKETTAPINEWANAFKLPSARIIDGPIAVFNSTQVGVGTITGFEIFGDQLFTNEAVIVVDYQTIVDESKWPKYFVEFMTKVMMVELAFPITDINSVRIELYKEVFGLPNEAGMGGMFAAARARNSRETPPVPISDFTLINARFGGL